MKIYIVMRLDSRQNKETWVVDKAYTNKEAADVRSKRLKKWCQPYIITSTLRGAVRKINDDSKRSKKFKLVWMAGTTSNLSFNL